MDYLEQISLEIQRKEAAAMLTPEATPEVMALGGISEEATRTGRG